MKYTLFAWRSDNEGGIGVCPSEKFSPMTAYQPETGWRAEPSQKIGDFSNVDELIDVLLSSDPDFYTEETAKQDALEIMEHIYETEMEELWD